MTTIGNDDAMCSAREQALSAGSTHLSCTDKHHPALLEVVNLLRKIDRHATHAGRAALDAGLIAHFFTDREGLLEKFIQAAARVPASNAF